QRDDGGPGDLEHLADVVACFFAKLLAEDLAQIIDNRNLAAFHHSPTPAAQRKGILDVGEVRIGGAAGLVDAGALDVGEGAGPLGPKPRRRRLPVSGGHGIARLSSGAGGSQAIFPTSGLRRTVMRPPSAAASQPRPKAASTALTMSSKPNPVPLSMVIVTLW